MELTPAKKEDLRLWVDVLEVFSDMITALNGKSVQRDKLLAYIRAVKAESIKRGNHHPDLPGTPGIVLSDPPPPVGTAHIADDHRPPPQIQGRLW